MPVTVSPADPQYDEVARDPEGFLRSVLDPGGAIVTGMPKDDGNSGKSLSDFVWKYFGGLQKHPVRDNAHWVISTEKSESNKGSYSNLKDEDVRASANSYNTDQQLANHTDQSNYGTPGLLLMFHCAMGEGNNSLTDGFAVAYAMQERYPEMFELLATHGMNAGRRNELRCWVDGCRLCGLSRAQSRHIRDNNVCTLFTLA